MTTQITTRVRSFPDRPALSEHGYLVLTRSSSPGAVGRVYALSSTEVVIGRATDVELQIDDDGISRRHVRVFVGPDGRHWVEDLQSTNGTYLNGVRSRSAGLEEGDQIQIGSATALRFSFRPALVEAEENLQRALATAQVATFSWDLKSETITWSEQADVVCHTPVRHSAHSVAGFMELVHPEDGERIGAALDRALQGNEQFEVDFRFRTDGARGPWILSRGDVLRGADGEPLRIVGTVMDITERKLVEQDLRRHALLFEAFDDAVVLVSREGQVVDWNSSAERMFGISKAEAIGHPYAALLGLTDADLLDGSRFARLSERWRGEQRIARRGMPAQAQSSELFCETVMFPLQSQEGNFLTTVAVHRDVTRARALQAQLMTASRLASVGTLAAGVAHEINNPLAFVIANLDYLLEVVGTLPGEKVGPRLEFEQLLEETRQGAARIARIVRDLKTFSRTENDAQLGPVDVVPAVEFALQMAQNHLKHRARVMTDLKPVARVVANASRLGHVVLHLLMNAAQAIPESSHSEHQIRVSTYPDAQGRVVVEVQDSGVGIPRELQQRIFDPFFTTKPVGTGTGLGLAICHSIVQAAGGEIQLQSAPGQGSTFRLILPPAPEEVAGYPPTASGVADAGKKPRVLVLDDEPLIGGAVQRLLRPTHEVTIALDISEAMSLLREGQRFDAVLCDVMLNRETAQDLHEQIQTVDPSLASRTVFMTGGAFSDRAQAFLRSSPNPTINKPLDPTELRLALARVMARRDGQD